MTTENSQESSEQSQKPENSNQEAPASARGVGPPREPTELSAEQLVALQCIVLGLGVNATARAAKVDRASVQRWMQKGEPFEREMQDIRRAACDEARMQMACLASLALELVESEVQCGGVSVAVGFAREMRTLHRLEAVDADLPAPVERPQPLPTISATEAGTEATEGAEGGESTQ